MFQSDAVKLYAIGRYITIAAHALNAYWSGDSWVLDMLTGHEVLS